MEKTTSGIVSGISDGLNKAGINYTINQVGSMYSLFFNTEAVNNFDDAKNSNLEHFGVFFNKMLERGIYLPPSQFETLFVSNCINDEIADKLISASVETIKEMQLA